MRGTSIPGCLRGVTMIELMIVVVIVSILAAVAYPNYRQYVERSKRNEAKAALLQIATNQERFYLNNNAYTTNMTSLGFPVNSNYTTDSGAYEVNVTAADASGFTAEATYREGGKEAEKCLTYGINGSGVKSSGPEPDCWTRSR
ncbi:MAG: type IV pilin protein [Woeseia sp.]